MQENPYQPGQYSSPLPRPPAPRLSGFDKFCAGSAFVLGIVFIGLGALGLFAGCSAHFTLPPILGVVPAFVGWGIVRAVRVAWNTPTDDDPPPRHAPDQEWDD